jgi:tetratricopeptide (TPR) repeat protein
MIGVKREGFHLTFSLSNVPDVEHFVGRDVELAEIHKKLGGRDSRRTVVLHGLGGIGKTQLSVAYAKQHKNSYSAILWFDIRDEDSLTQSFVRVARQIFREHPSASGLSNVKSQEDLDEVIDAVKAWLSLANNTQWLAIYDNYDNPKVHGNTHPAAVDIRKFLPESYQGAVIITTRSSQVRMGHPISVHKFRDVEDSLDILSSSSSREGIGSGKNSGVLIFTISADSVIDPVAFKLAQELDGLPLALATAGAYLDQVSISVSDYLRLYKSSWVQLQTTSPHLDSYEDRTLYSTWQISFDHVKQQSDLAANLLRFWAYFDSQDLWLELLRHRESDCCDDNSWLSQLSRDEMIFHQTMRILCDHGLVDTDMTTVDLVESRGYSIHGCVHQWTIHVLNLAWDHELAVLAVQFVANHESEQQGAQVWTTSHRRLRHAIRCSDMIQKNLIMADTVRRECFLLGGFFDSMGKPREAEQIYQRALKSEYKADEPLDPSDLDTINSLACIYREQGRLGEAERMFEQVIDGNENKYGSTHHLVLDAVNNLGNVYKSQGKLWEAEQMYQRALEGYEREVTIPYDVKILDTLTNLGNVYADQNQLTEAEDMYQRALVGYEKQETHDDISTLDLLNNLGLLYAKQNKLVQAEQMYQRAIQGYEKAKGPNNMLTLDIINNLGTLYADHQGKVVEAKEIYERVLQGYEETLGADKMVHYVPALHTIWNLGELSENRGDLENAHTMYSKALAGYIDVLGHQHSTSRESQDKVNEILALVEKGRRAELEEPVHQASEGSSQTTPQGTTPKTKRHRLLRKLRLR